MTSNHEIDKHILASQEIRGYVTQQSRITGVGEVPNANPQFVRAFWEIATLLISRHFLDEANQMRDSEVNQTELREAAEFYARIHLFLSHENTKSSIRESRWWLAPRHKVIDRSLVPYYLQFGIVKEENEIWKPLTDSQKSVRESILKEAPLLTSTNWTKVPLAPKFREISNKHNPTVRRDNTEIDK